MSRGRVRSRSSLRPPARPMPRARYCDERADSRRGDGSRAVGRPDASGPAGCRQQAAGRFAEVEGWLPRARPRSCAPTDWATSFNCLRTGLTQIRSLALVPGPSSRSDRSMYPRALVLAGLLVVSLAHAQTARGPYARVAVLRPHEGHTVDFEAGYVRHLDWH